MRPAIQLYSLREMDASLPEILEQVAAAGFEGVEFATMISDADTEAVAETLEATGLEPIGAHVSLSDLESMDEESIEQFQTLDCHTLVVPHISPTSIRTVQRVTEVGNRLNRTAQQLEREGFELSYHNQFHDFTRPIGSRVLSQVVEADAVPTAGEYGIELVHGRVSDTVRRASFDGTKLGHLTAVTNADLVSYELDVGWVSAGGYDPEEVLQAIDNPVWSLHLNDVAQNGSGDFESTRPGRGIVDFDHAAAAADRHGVEWLIYENDDPDDPEATIEHGADAVVPLTDD